MKLDLQTIIKIVVSLLAIGLVVFILRGVDLGQALSLLLTANPALLVAVLGAQAICLVVRLVRWQSLLLPAKWIPLRTLVAPMLIGWAIGNVTVTGVGAVPRIYLLNRRSNVDSGFITGTWIQEFILDATALTFWAAMVTFLVALPAEFQQMRLALAVASVILLGLNLFLWRRQTQPAVAEGGNGRWKWIERHLPSWATAKVDTFGAGVSAFLGHRRALALTVLSTAAIWAFESLVFWLLLMSLGIPFTYPQASAITVFTYLVTGIPSVPGFIGTLELSTVGLVLALGGEQSMALAYVVLLRIFFMGPTTIVGGIMAWREGLRLGSLSGRSSEREG